MLRLTRDHLEKLNAALAAVELVSPYGEVRLVVERGRISAIETMTSMKYHDLASGSPDAARNDA